MPPFSFPFPCFFPSPKSSRPTRAKHPSVASASFFPLLSFFSLDARSPAASDTIPTVSRSGRQSPVAPSPDSRHPCRSRCKFQRPTSSTPQPSAISHRAGIRDTTPSGSSPVATTHIIIFLQKKSLVKSEKEGSTGGSTNDFFSGLFSCIPPSIIPKPTSLFSAPHSAANRSPSLVGFCSCCASTINNTHLIPHLLCSSATTQTQNSQLVEFSLLLRWPATSGHFEHDKTPHIPGKHSMSL
ncbi:hypothetical protein QBC41DRAFT_115280 [Cercophora samala]|uniref:Uncharacterized protein n=1 Tax=Cercophora samala TaxID=330535 RepID=A0AA39ZLZ6_9PEZI|nr:hypothetical protein QBC41DRAFT_115280 [Cercophora samala]